MSWVKYRLWKLKVSSRTRNGRPQDGFIWHDENVINTILYAQHFAKKNTQQLQLITKHSGSPPAVQCSSSRTYCQFHAPTCQYMCDLHSLAVCDWAITPTGFTIKCSCPHYVQNIIKRSAIFTTYWQREKRTKFAKITFKKFCYKKLWARGQCK
jgi:hypothetical protein